MKPSAVNTANFRYVFVSTPKKVWVFEQSLHVAVQYSRSPRWRIRLSSSLVLVSFVKSNPPECILV